MSHNFDDDDFCINTPPDSVIRRMSQKMGQPLPDIFLRFHTNEVNWHGTTFYLFQTEESAQEEADTLNAERGTAFAPVAHDSGCGYLVHDEASNVSRDAAGRDVPA